MKETRRDIVDRLLGYCLKSRENAKELFEALISGQKQSVRVEGEEIELTDEERGEFVERFSAEIEPTLWESKRLKQ